MLLPHDCLNKSDDYLGHKSSVFSKPSPGNQVMATILIPNNAICVWTMDLYIDSVMLVLEAPRVFFQI